MEMILKSATCLAMASKGDPVKAILVVMLYFGFFTILESLVEKLIFGESFEHWLDPLFVCVFIAYSGISVWACAAVNSISDET